MLNPRRRSLLLLVLALVGTGCTAARSGIQLQTASDAREVAVDRNAGELAPYELGMATHYLRKAWEEAGHGEHKYSVVLAKKSIEWTDRALVQVERGPRTLEVEDLDEMPEARPVPARPLPQPTPEDTTMPEPTIGPFVDDDDEIEIEGAQ